MKTQLMTQAQESTPAAALWTVEDGEAMRLDIGPGARELQVTAGRLWLTREGTAQRPAEDLWLSSGETVALEHGSEWVVEAWGTVHFHLMVPPAACASQRQRLSARSVAPRASSWLQAAAS